MTRMADGATRIRLAVVIIVGSAVALLLPAFSAASVDASSVVMLTAVAALVAALVGSGRHALSLEETPPAGPLDRAARAPSFLAARVTDTAHHPQRPRAPGVV